MPYKIVLNDITAIEVEAIVNNIPVTKNVSSLVFKNTVVKKLENQIKDINVNDELEIKVDQLGNKKIIHIVSPKKENDDELNNKLLDAYRKIISTCIDNNIKSVAITLLGIGSNGYSFDDSYKALSKAILELIKREEENNELLKVVFVPYNPKDERYRFAIREKVCRGIGEREQKFRNNSRFIAFSNLYNIELNGQASMEERNQELIDRLLENNPLNLLYKYPYPFEYVLQWMKTAGVSEETLKSRCLLSDRNIKTIKERKSFDKSEIYALGMLLGLSPVNTIELLKINNLMFNPKDKLDMLEVNYLTGKYYDIPFIDFCYLASEESGKWLNFSTKK